MSPRDDVENWLRTALASLSEAVITIDCQGRILQMNPEAERLTGLQEDEARGKPLSAVFRLINEEKQDEVENAVEQLLRQEAGIGWIKDCLLISRHGEEIPLLYRGAPIRTEKGDVVGVVLVFRQLQPEPEGHRADEALRLSEERYHTVSEMISDYAYAFRVEADGRLVREWLAGSFEQITGFTPEESQARGGWRALIYPPDMPIAMRRFETLLSGEPDVSEFRIVRKDGRIRWLRDHARPIWDEQLGRVVRIYGAAQDITERKLGELERQALAQIAQAIGQEIDFQAIAERLIQATLLAVPSAQKGSLAVLADATHLKVVALVGYHDPLVRGLTYSIDWGYAGRCYRLQKPFLIADVAQDDELAQDAAAASIEEVRAIRSAIVAPLKIHDKIMGVVSFESNKPHAFTEEDLTLLNTLAGTLALVLHNAQLHEETNRHLRQLQAVQTVGKALLASLDVRLVFEVLIQQALNHLQADAAGLLLFNPYLQTLEYATYSGFRSRHYEQTFLSLATSLAGKAATERQIVTLTDLGQLSLGFAQTFREEGFQAYGAAPLIAKGKLKGVLEVFYRRPFAPDAEWKRLLELLADQAAVAIDNAEMFEEPRRGACLYPRASRQTIRSAHCSGVLRACGREFAGGGKRCGAIMRSITGEGLLPVAPVRSADDHRARRLL